MTWKWWVFLSAISERSWVKAHSIESYQFINQLNLINSNFWINLRRTASVSEYKWYWPSVRDYISPRQSVNHRNGNGDNWINATVPFQSVNAEFRFPFQNIYIFIHFLCRSLGLIVLIRNRDSNRSVFIFICNINNDNKAYCTYNYIFLFFCCFSQLVTSKRNLCNIISIKT